MAAGRVDSESRKSRDSESHIEDEEIEVEEEEPNFSDPEDFVDDVTDEELLGDVLRKRPKPSDSVDSVIIVDCIPKVGKERLDKLKNVIKKLFSKFGTVVNAFYPLDDEGNTKGYMFLEFSSPQNAHEAVKMTNGYKLDKQHSFKVNHFSDFEKYINVPDEWTPPDPKPYQDLGNLRSWLQNKESYDQFSVIYGEGEKTAIFLNTPEPSMVEERARWTETYVRWSPQGTYLATFHVKGIALWGGPKFSQIMRFSHPGVQLIDFSPCEKYLVTFSPLQDNHEDPQAIIIWDIRSGAKKRGFHCESRSTWPIFKWNQNGNYFARIGEEAISIYETPSFGLLDKKSLKIPAVRDFSWSPTDDIIAYWVPEQSNTPARVTLIEIPSRNELCVRNLFNVADCKMHWQKSGDYLCVKVDRYKTKKTDDKDQIKYSGIYYNFELFRIREKQIPVDKVEEKDPVLAFAWEPIGNKFAYIHGEAPRINVTFYNIQPKGKVELLKTFEKRSANHLFWSPNGQFIVLAGLRSMNGVLEFIDTQDMTVMTQTEHFMATDVEWDPTGRYVVSAVSWWGHKVDNGYWLWNFQGILQHKQPLEKFCQLQWRPRPPSLLSENRVKEIKKNFKTWAQKFEQEDSMRKMTASKDMLEKRRKLMEDFREYRSQKDKEFAEMKEIRLQLRSGIDTDELHNQEDNFTEEIIEFLIKAEEKIVEE
ncbi:eukaryotic translation initiation factor 3 subunit B [Biomphalaria glabrata]|uniref:Eukaryotic translation initiation factor 3 subunit B n=1 Tax=Biomphalaria glabrata TaxID=6526 RepID=A0A9W2ZLZ5_BIOGL|nr:eukaryotic translation initiation factor 3 subunit B-like [Biomphalaria glabrata]